MRNTYSLPRLLKNWTRLQAADTPIRVGAVVVNQSEEELFLSGQGVHLRLAMAGLAKFEVGSIVSFLCEPKNLQVDPQLRTVAAKACSDLQLIAKAKAPRQLDFSPSVAQEWDAFLSTIRVHLREIGLLQVQTPTLVKNSGMEAHLEPIVTTWRYGSSSLPLPLSTSPELHLKKLLCHEFTDIYEIKTCYRNQELTQIHEPEFTMLEWYRSYADLDLIQDDLVGMLRRLQPSVAIKVTSFKELFQSEFHFELRPSTTFSELKKLAAEIQLDIHAANDFDDAFALITSFALEPRLNPEEATIIYGFPPSQAALAKIGDDGFAKRFELYWHGLEIANAFDELTDPELQKQRHLTEQEKRKQLGRTPLPLDEQFLHALEKGLPPTGGIALGLDRLFMAVYGISSIRKTRAFSAREHLAEGVMANE